MLLAALLLAACNGGGGPARPPGPGTPTVGSCQPLTDAEKFRYQFRYDLESLKPQGSIDTTAVGDPPFALAPDAPDFTFFQEMDGSFVSPDAADTLSRSSASSLDLAAIYVGGRQWVKLGDTWVESTGSPPLPFPPLEVCDALLGGIDLSAATPSHEEVDGADALHYRLQDVELEAARTLFGGEQSGDIGRLLNVFSVDVWLREKDGMPLRIEGKSVGTYPSDRELSLQLSLQIMDVNDADITVTPPVASP